MKKRLLSTLLALCMALTMLPETARAEEASGTCGDNLTWSYSNGTLTIQGTGSMTNYNPWYGESMSAPPWYDYREQIKTVKIGDDVTSIGEQAFYECNNLISVTIPNNITSIGEQAFYECSNLASVIIPNSVNSIGERTFFKCSKLNSVALSNSITSIEPYTFYGCGLTSVTIPNSVTSIGERAFYECSNLTNATISNSVITIEPYAFYGCGLTNITIPNSVTRIGESAFENCTSLISATILMTTLNNVISIGRCAFYNCNNLTDLIISTGVTSIGELAFNGCSSLTSVIVPHSVVSIGYEAFRNCSNLTRVTIPDSVTYIGASAFADCRSLLDVYYSGSESQWEQLSQRSGNPHPNTNTTISLSANATVHYNSYTRAEPSQGSSTPSNNSPNADEYVYNIADFGEDTKLDANRLNRVADPATAAAAVRDMVNSMTQEQKESPTGIDLATLYAETAIAKAASKTVDSSDIVINAAAVSDVAAEAEQTLSAVEDALSSGGITTARELSKTVTLTTNVTSQITIRIHSDVLGTEVDKVRVETPNYALTFKLSDLAPDLTDILTFKAALANVETLSVADALDLEMPDGGITNSIAVSLPTDKSVDIAYQAIVNQSTGTTATSKYNPATDMMDGKTNISGTYTTKTNEMDFADITSKSTEMQKAVKYLASHGISLGTSSTTFSPDESISREQLTTLVVRALGKVDNKATTQFTDVVKGSTYYAPVASSQKLGYINGFEDNTFRGSITINKEQIVAIAARVLGAEMNYKTPSNPAAYLSKYSDTVVSWAQPQVALATRENLVVYRTDGTFSGAKNMTRGDAAIIIYRLFQRIW